MRKLLIVVFLMLLISCTPFEKAKNILRPVVSSNCGGIIDWVDFLMINDIHYGAEQQIGNQSTQKGKKLGEVQYRVADNVTCTDYQTKNGDAAFLQEGTEIYEIQGYSEKFRVMAGGKVYEVTENHKAKTIEDLYDIKEKVAKIIIFRDTHDQDIRTIDPAKVERITNLFLERELISLQEIYRRGVAKTTFQYFIEFILQDGTSIRTMYMAGSEVFSRGAYLGPELEKELKAITMKEWNQ
jgi:hypothetical protein